MAKYFRLIALLAMACCAAACGGGGSSAGSTNGSSSSSSSSSSVVIVTAPSGLSYTSPATYTVGTAITALNPSVVGTATSYSVAPALPAGLSINTVSGQITGTPTAVTAASYTITASNSLGSTTFVLSIAVNPLGAATVSVTYGVKQVILNWVAVSGATYYQVSKKPNSIASYAQLDANLNATTYTDVVAVHLTDWANVSYIVAACNSAGCVNSTVVSALDAKAAVGYFKASNGSDSRFFGDALALSTDGNTLAIGAYAESSDATGINGTKTGAKSYSGAVYVFVRTGTSWSQQAYIKASATDINDHFGTQVALSADGNTLVVSATGEDSNATGIGGSQTDNSKESSGAVYAFTRTGATWSQQAYIKASNTDINDYFGTHMALSADGNTLVVGASGEASNATGIGGSQTDNSKASSGAVYSFTRTGTTWSQEAYIKASNPDTDDYFGSHMALSADGNTLVVGATGEDSNAMGIGGSQTNNAKLGSGAVYAFTRTGTAWSQQAYIKASTTVSYAFFGSALALSADGHTLVVGADSDDNLGAQAGAVYAFTRTGTAWAQQAYFKSSNINDRDYFGTSVALSADGNVLVVGAHVEDSNATGMGGSQADNSKVDSGAAYAFTRTGTTWSQQGYIKATNTGADDEFGYAVALSGDGSTLAVGAHYEDSSAMGIGGVQENEGGGETGAVYVY